MSIVDVQAIDSHGHYGNYYRPRTDEHLNQFASGDGPEVVRRARIARTQWTIVSPLAGLFPRGPSIAETEQANEDTAELIERTDGLLQYVIVDPRRPQTYEQAQRMLARPRCVGIKIHGEEHQYFLQDYGEEIFAFAARMRAVVLAHSGDKHTMPADFVPYADRFPEVRLILAHLGHNPDNTNPTEQVRAIQAGKHDNLWTDTSSIVSIFPGLIEWAAREIPVNRILFGTDTPLYHAPTQRARIDSADLDDADKHAILRDNAVGLFSLKEAGLV